MTKKVFKKSMRLALVLVAVFMIASPSQAADLTVNLAAVEGTWTPPNDPGPIPMWGFVPDTGQCPAGSVAWSLGPRIEALAGDNLTINLRNCLDEEVSIVLTGQAPPTDGTDTLTPVFHMPYSADGDTRPRMRSLTAETSPGTRETYIWRNLKAGSFIYHSGTNLSKQVHMGLYGEAKVDNATGQAYPGIGYDQEITLFFSEIDPSLHDPPSFSYPNGYTPEYFLVNGSPYVDGATGNLVVGAQGENILVRMYSTAMDDIVPQIMGTYWHLLAEDGNPYPYEKVQHTVLLPAMKTIDALLNSQEEGVFTVFDRRLNLTNGTAGNGGFFAKLEVQAAPLVARDDSYDTEVGMTLNIPAPGVMGNDLFTGTPTAVEEPDSPDVTLNPDGGFTYDAPMQAGQYFFTYRLNNVGPVVSNIAQVTLNVASAPTPVAVNDEYDVEEGVEIEVDAQNGILANDLSPSGNELEARLVFGSGPYYGVLNLQDDGAFTYTPGASATVGTMDAFNYEAVDKENQALVDRGLVVFNIVAGPNTNSAPVANNDFGETAQRLVLNGYVPLSIDVAANDTDPDGNLDPTTVELTNETTTNGGQVVNNGDGTVNYTPALGFVGTDTFAYTVMDAFGLESNQATVQINVVRAARSPRSTGVRRR